MPGTVWNHDRDSDALAPLGLRADDVLQVEGGDSTVLATGDTFVTETAVWTGWRPVLESAARVELLLAELGLVRCQVYVDGVGHVDLLVREWLVVEAAGFGHHSTRDSYREDRRRDDELARRGYVVLRFTWEDVTRRPGWMVTVVRDVSPVVDRRSGPDRTPADRNAGFRHDTPPLTAPRTGVSF